MGWILLLVTFIFALMLPRGTNVPYATRPVIVKTLIVVNLAFHVVTQVFDWSSGSIFEQAKLHRRVDREEIMRRPQTPETPLEKYYDIVGLTPAKLPDEPWRWVQVITANFIHGNWMHVVTNLWIFAIYAINLEDLFGRRRFLLFILVSCLVSYLAVALFTVGSNAYYVPHLGFSGVVYAAMTAYLVCFPRSKVNVVLIYDIRFWLLVLFPLSIVMLVALYYVGTLAQLVWIVAFVLLFVQTQPEHASFGVPALFFLGFKLAQDAVSLESQADEGQVSVWAHSGGFMVGVAAGFLFNGMKGFDAKYDPAEPEKPRSKREQARMDAEQLARMGETDEAAARHYLGQRVFTGDAASATEFYINTVLPKYPNLMLDARDQMSLARMLEFRGKQAAALHVYDVLLWNRPETPEVEASYLSAAALTRGIPERIPDGIRYLNRFESFGHILMRDRMEVRRLKDELQKIAAEKNVDLGDALEQCFTGDPAQACPPSSTAPKNIWGQKVESPAAGPIPMRLRRMKQLEPTTAAPDVKAPETEPTAEVPEVARERAEQRRATVEPIKLFFQEEQSENLKAAEPKNPDEPTYGVGMPVSEGTLTPRRVRKPEAEPVQMRTVRDKVREVPRRSTDQDSDYKPRKSLPVGDAKPGGENKPDKYHGQFGYGDSALAPSDSEVFSKAFPLRMAIPARVQNKEPEGPRYAALLTAGAAVAPDRLLEALRPEYDNEEDARRALIEGKGLIAQNMTEDKARTFRERLSVESIAVEIINQAHPALADEPIEVTGVEILEAELLCKTHVGRFRVNLPDVVVLNYAQMKLSSASRSMRKCIEIVASPEYRRVHIWERTLNPIHTQVDGKQIVSDDPVIDVLFRALSERVSPEALTVAARKALQPDRALAAFNSLQVYENYLAYCILSRAGERLK